MDVTYPESATIRWKALDRDGWDAGQWDYEPDQVSWYDPGTGCPCQAIRDESGYWCAAVAVGEVLAALVGRDHSTIVTTVHGGLTWSGPSNETYGSGEEFESGAAAWWFGFHCGHVGLADGWPNQPGDYRTLEYVVEQCATLASDLLFTP